MKSRRPSRTRGEYIAVRSTAASLRPTVLSGRLEFIIYDLCDSSAPMDFFNIRLGWPPVLGWWLGAKPRDQSFQQFDGGIDTVQTEKFVGLMGLGDIAGT